MTNNQKEAIAAPIESRMDRIDRRARIKARRDRERRAERRVKAGAV